MEDIFRLMKTMLPPLLPIFRSDAQAKLLAVLFLAPEDGLSLGDVADRAGVAAATAHREIERLEEAGIVTSERRGRTRLVRPDPRSPYHPELRALIWKAFGPVRILSEALSVVEGVGEAYVFGSWARRYRGEAGPPPRDVDVLVVGDADPDDVYDACRRAEERVGLAVNATVLSPREWESGETGFLRRIRGEPMIPLAETA